MTLREVQLHLKGSASHIASQCFCDSFLQYSAKLQQYIFGKDSLLRPDVSIHGKVSHSHYKSLYVLP